MLNEYEAYFVFGKRGRFGSRFNEVLKKQKGKVYGYSSEEVSEGVHFLVSKLRANSRCCVFWCLGAGNSAESTKYNREYNLLNYFYAEIKRSRLSLSQLLVIYVSTGGKMYGLDAGHVSEDSVLYPVGIYGKHKRECELLIQETSRKYEINSIIFRIANAYSLKSYSANPKGFVETCFSTIEQNKKLKFTADPNSVRQYASHSDYVVAILETIDRIENVSTHLLCNLAPDFAYTLFQIVDAFEKHFNKNINLEYYDLDKLKEDSLIIESNKTEIRNLKAKWSTIEDNLLPL